jgi:hypothetical protein
VLIGGVVGLEAPNPPHPGDDEVQSARIGDDNGFGNFNSLWRMDSCWHRLGN